MNGESVDWKLVSVGGARIVVNERWKRLPGDKTAYACSGARVDVSQNEDSSLIAPDRLRQLVDGLRRMGKGITSVDGTLVVVAGAACR